jgi:hypothetical protein
MRRPLRWSIEQRLAFIEERLFWIGAVNRTDLVRRFGVSMSQASADLGRYLARKPAGVAYDVSAKRYVAGADFRPILAEPEAGRLLGELRLVDLRILDEAETTLGTVPPFAATPVPERTVDPFVLRRLLQAIREHLAVEVSYQSMSRPEVTRRTIEPHALAHDGFRWHVRAFDRTTGAFRDFVIGRVSKPKEAGAATHAGTEDREWQEVIDLRIAPHPGLTPAQSQAIAVDYGIRRGSAAIPVRRALLFYALKRLGLDVPDSGRSPQAQHIVLINRDEIDKALVGSTEI